MPCSVLAVPRPSLAPTLPLCLPLPFDARAFCPPDYAHAFPHTCLPSPNTLPYASSFLYTTYCCLPFLLAALEEEEEYVFYYAFLCLFSPACCDIFPLVSVEEEEVQFPTYLEGLVIVLPPRPMCRQCDTWRTCAPPTAHSGGFPAPLPSATSCMLFFLFYLCHTFLLYLGGSWFGMFVAFFPTTGLPSFVLLPVLLPSRFTCSADFAVNNLPFIPTLALYHYAFFYFYHLLPSLLYGTLHCLPP